MCASSFIQLAATAFIFSNNARATCDIYIVANGIYTVPVPFMQVALLLCNRCLDDSQVYEGIWI